MPRPAGDWVMGEPGELLGKSYGMYPQISAILRSVSSKKSGSVNVN
jgi:hypothetical protein